MSNTPLYYKTCAFIFENTVLQARTINNPHENLYYSTSSSHMYSKSSKCTTSILGCFRSYNQRSITESDSLNSKYVGIDCQI
jgi:hypothetical protein